MPQSDRQPSQSAHAPKAKGRSRRRKKSGDRRSAAGTAAESRRSLSPEEVLQEGLPGLTVETLKALGLLTERGGASPNSNRKLKQIKHFLRLIEPALRDCFERHEEPVLIDAGAGRAALSLALYDLWIRPRNRGRLIAIEGRPELVERVRDVAKVGGYDRLELCHATIREAQLPERVHFTLALHACDTATDEAILRALAHRSDHVAFVPCCQAELARLLAEHQGPLSPLWRRRWHRREFGAQLTNVIRAELLQAKGYAVTVTELAGWEHSLKNELMAKLVEAMAGFTRGGAQEVGT